MLGAGRDHCCLACSHSAGKHVGKDAACKVAVKPNLGAALIERFRLVIWDGFVSFRTGMPTCPQQVLEIPRPESQSPLLELLC